MVSRRVRSQLRQHGSPAHCDRNDRTEYEFVRIKTQHIFVLQPFDPPRRISGPEYDATRGERKRSEVCTLRQAATVAETLAMYADFYPHPRKPEEVIDLVGLAAVTAKDVGVRDLGRADAVRLFGMGHRVLSV